MHDYYKPSESSGIQGGLTVQTRVKTAMTRNTGFTGTT